MNDPGIPQIERSIARCRLVLSVVALLVVYVDPTTPLLSSLVVLRFGTFVIDPYTLAVLLAHLAYSTSVMLILRQNRMSPSRLKQLTTWGDVGFGTAIAAFTEGINSPMYAFFIFAVIATGLTADMRRTVIVTTVSLFLYLSLILVSSGGVSSFYVMRPAYLAITGYLVGYLGQERLKLEAGIRELAAAHQRQQIARDLHDGRAQALAGITLRLESCRELLRRGSHAEAIAEISDLQGSVNREYDELRAYMRALVGLDTPPAEVLRASTTRFSMQVDLTGSANLIAQVLQIVREGVTNICRHAQARVAAIDVRRVGSQIAITIDDDGVGFPEEERGSWTISSLAGEMGGSVTVVRDKRPGAHLAIAIQAG